MLALVAALSMTTSTEVTFTGVDGVTLRGTYLRPAGSAKVPAVLLLPGSGPVDRNGNVPQAGMTTNLLKDLAEALAAKGVATLRFDKRATPGYAAVWPKTLPEIDRFFRYEAFEGDAQGGLAWLAKRSDVDGKRVGLLGHSEGAMIALGIAAKNPSSVRAIALLGCVGRPMETVIMDQLRMKLPMQVPANQVKTYLDYATAAFDAARASKPFPPNPPMGMQGLFNPSAASLIRGYMAIDTLAWAKRVRAPVLVLNGEFDNQVLAEQDAKPLIAAFRARSRATTESWIVPKASHNFKASPNLQADTFAGPLVAGVADRVAGFFAKGL